MTVGRTPGPWEARPTRSGKLWQVLTVDPGGPLICELRTGAADANLIAAAPEMSDTGNTLSAYIYSILNPGEIPSHVKAAMAVFANAEGRS